jgi:hypothetical protein
MGEEYILPGEFLALVAFWFGPPLLVAFALQVRSFSKRNRLGENLGRLFSTMAITALLSIVFSFFVLAASPHFFGVFGVRDIKIAGHSFMLLPLSFLAVAVVAPIVTWVALAGFRQRPN